MLQHFLQRLVQDHGGSERDYLTADNKLKAEFCSDFYDLIAQNLNQYGREIHPELEAQFLEFCAGEKERRRRRHQNQQKVGVADSGAVGDQKSGNRRREKAGPVGTARADIRRTFVAFRTAFVA